MTFLGVLLSVLVGVFVGFIVGVSNDEKQPKTKDAKKLEELTDRELFSAHVAIFNEISRRGAALMEPFEEFKKKVRRKKGMCKMPKAGDKVYVLYRDELSEDTVFAVGEKHFILESFRTTVELYWLQNFEDEGTTWFFSLEDAKDELMSRYNDEYELVEYTKRWYGVRRL